MSVIIIDIGNINAQLPILWNRKIVTTAVNIIEHNIGWTTRGNKSFNKSAVTVKSWSNSPSLEWPDFTGNFDKAIL